jgi:NADH-ubiquinone oxidoreductase chain 5
MFLLDVCCLCYRWVGDNFGFIFDLEGLGVPQILLVIFSTGGIYILISFFGRYLSVSGLLIIAVFGLLSNFIFSVFYFFCSFPDKTFYIFKGTWFDGMLDDVSWIFFFDYYAFIMFVVVNIMTFFIIVYSFDYMSHDPHLYRFISYLFLFSFFMVLLVTAGNMIQLFIGWEGVGIVSYLLVNFWFTRLEAVRSAIKAILFNKVGDIGFIVLCVFMFYVLKTFDIVVLKYLFLVSDLGDLKLGFDDMLTISFCGLILAAIAKSAQIPLHAWLPDAMEGPTPVSAFLHSATMVTAGLFLFLRFDFFVCSFPTLCFYVGWLGGMTAIFGASVALMQYDIKKIIAYSTCSQLGLMFTSFSLFNISGCLYHLVSHACFKALLFLTAGNLIHHLFDEQDIRRMGGLVWRSTFTFISMLVGMLGACAFPYLTGFYSKETLLFMQLSVESGILRMIFGLQFFASIFTILYSVRLLYLVFFSWERQFRPNLISVEFFEVGVFTSLLGLSLFTLFLGFFTEDLMSGAGSFISQSVFPNVSYNQLNFAFREEVSVIIKIFFYFLFLIVLSFYIVFKHSINLVGWKKSLNSKNIYVKLLKYFVSDRWFFNKLYVVGMNTTFWYSYNVFFTKLDRGFFERMGPWFILRMLNKTASFLLSFNQYKMSFYLHWFNFGFIFYMLCCFFFFKALLFFGLLMGFVSLIFSMLLNILIDVKHISRQR